MVEEEEEEEEEEEARRLNSQYSIEKIGRM
jgi:hypothetical protein